MTDRTQRTGVCKQALWVKSFTARCLGLCVSHFQNRPGRLYQLTTGREDICTTAGGLGLSIPRPVARLIVHVHLYVRLRARHLNGGVVGSPDG